MNIVMVRPDITRRQILVNAAHQFSEGDVPSTGGMKRIILVLEVVIKMIPCGPVYATSIYIDTTEDYDILKRRNSLCL